MADSNKDEANKALDIAVENLENGKYEEALESANRARLMNPQLPGIKKLVTLLQVLVLSADPDITYYEFLGVEETDTNEEIHLACSKLEADLNPATNKFPKASEAHGRIIEAMVHVLGFRSKYDNELDATRKARARVAKIETDIAKLETEYNASRGKHYLAYLAALRQAAAECEALAQRFRGMMYFSKLQAAFQKKNVAFKKKKAAVLEKKAAVLQEKEAAFQRERAEYEALVLQESLLEAPKVLEALKSTNEKSMADLNKDEAIKALEKAKENTINGKYDEALKSANDARLLNPELTDIEKLVTLLQVLSAKPDITHYEILRVEETASVNEIRRAYLKLSVDLNPDTNNFPKASEAYRRISVAMKVLSHDRLNYDKALAVAREARSQVAEFEPLRIQDFAFDGLVSSMHTKSMANFNKDEANKGEEEPSKTLIGIRARDQARKRVAKFEVDIAEIEAIYKDFVFDLCARAIVAKDFLGYREALARAAAECEAPARTLDGMSMIYSRELQKKKAFFQEKKAAFEALFDTDLLVDREAPPRAAAREVARKAAATAARESADRQAAPQEDSTHDVAAREDDASFVYIDPITGISYFTESFSTDSSSADTDSSSADTGSSTNASFTDDVGPGSKRASDAQSTSTPHTPKKRRDH